MKRVVSLGLCMVILASAATAMALEDGLTGAVYVNGQDAGIITPFLIYDAGRWCVYETEWVGPGGRISTQCDVLEGKVAGHLSCRNNRFHFFNTAIVNGLNCEGWDSFGVPDYVDFLYAGESENYTINGMILFAHDHRPNDFIVYF